MTIWFLFTGISLKILQMLLEREHISEENLRDFINYFAQNDVKVVMSFILVFLTLNSIEHWMELYKLLHWPDDVAMSFNANVDESSLSFEDMRKVRNSVARYLILTYILLLRDISIKMLKKFPSIEDLVKSGYITYEESKFLEVANLNPEIPIFWIPIEWIRSIIKKYYIRDEETRSQERSSIMTDHHYAEFIEILIKFRGDLSAVKAFDSVPIPLAQTQLITLIIPICAIAQFFRALDLGLQSENFVSASSIIGIIFVGLELMIFIGLTKCLQMIINPFGEDEDDFDVIPLLDRHSKTLVRLLINRVQTPN